MKSHPRVFVADFDIFESRRILLELSPPPSRVTGLAKLSQRAHSGAAVSTGNQTSRLTNGLFTLLMFQFSVCFHLISFKKKKNVVSVCDAASFKY